MFQFQTGSIKRKLYACQVEELFDGFNSKLVRLKVDMDKVRDGSPRWCFNSKLVRLKEGCRLIHNAIKKQFQFQTGSIKRKELINIYLANPSFNSKLVRLKGFMKTIHILYRILMGPCQVNF